MELIQQAYEFLMAAAVVVLAVMIILSIIRSILGPGISDRIIAVNMIGTMVIMVTAIFSVWLNENYLVDVCLIYAMISFLGVVVLCKVYTGVYLQRKHMKADLGAIEDNLSKQGVEIREEEEVKP
ncbi:MAG: sodium:proton antiporter [Hungatella sp.]|nr:sodium:proton antiporter [Hungatella sp.]